MNKKEEKDKKGHLSFQINEKLNEYLDDFVKNNGLKKSRLIEELLKNYINSKSFQFPTDDDIENELSELDECDSNSINWSRGFREGVQWMREKIKNNLKE